MAFQFLCPQGHLLESDQSQVGQQCQCPYCGVLFLVPQPIIAAPPDASAASVPTTEPPPIEIQREVEQSPRLTEFPAVGPPAEPPVQAPGPSFQSPVSEPPPSTPDFPGIQTESKPGATAGPVGQFQVQSASEMAVVHVACPNGHELETPREMLGQEAMCPFCQTQFWLRLEDSVEYRREKAEERERRETRIGQLWLRWAIVAAVVVVLGLVGMIAFSVAQ